MMKSGSTTLRRAARLIRPAAVIVLSTISAGVVASGIVPSEARADAALRAVASRGRSAVCAGAGGRVLFSSQAPHNAGWYPAASRTTEDLNAVSVGDDGYFAVGNGGKAMKSTDDEGIGTTWQLLGSRTRRDLRGVSHSSSRMVAVGDSAVIIRLDQPASFVWTLVDEEKIPTRKRLNSVSCGPSYTAAVGDSGTILWSLTSGMDTWNLAASVPTGEDLLGVAEGPGSPKRFWAVGRNGTLLRSDGQGSQWEALQSGTTAHLNGILFFGLIGLAVGDGGVILYSNGGQTWQQLDSGTTENLYGIGYTGSGAGGGFVAVGEENTILWSALGLTWQSAIVSTRETRWGSIRSSFR